ncbi:hypothetical protein ABFS83_13G037400 [Erythranthe nasuta]
MADYLPEEIVINILQRLPVETLVRCTAVRKSWYSLITSPEFISSHLKLAAAAADGETPLLLIRRRISSSERYELHSDGEPLTRVSKLKFPFSSTNSYFTIVGSCNGLLCIYDDRVDYTDTIILWNPCIKKSILLPEPNLIHNSYGGFAQSFGFGFDSIAGDYKVVRVSCVDDLDHQIELYKLSTGAWQDISSHLKFDRCFIIDDRSRQAYVNGATYWIASCPHSCDLIIVLFDMSTEVFGEIKLPIEVSETDPIIRKDLMVFDERLALVLCSDSAVEPTFCVWVMKEYGVEESWTKQLVFEFHILGAIFIRPVWVRKCGGIIAVLQDGGLYSFDLKDDEIKDLGVHCSGYEYYEHSFHVDSYIKSLVLLERGAYFSDSVTCDQLMPNRQIYDCDSIGSCESD